MAPTSEPEIKALCEMAARNARSRGHDIDGWERSAAGNGVAATATCRRCGRAVHVRLEGSLKGAAGRALAEECEQHGGS